MNTVHVVLPGGVDDPGHPSGGNLYDRRVTDGLVAAGWVVREHLVPGRWLFGQAGDARRLAAVLASVPDGSTVLVDGIIASVTPSVLVPASARLRVVVLLHLPVALGSGPAGDHERVVLASAAGVVTTSEWTRRWLVEHYFLDAMRVHVARPGTDPAPQAVPSVAGDRLLCVAALTPLKGHDLLLDALSEVDDLAWTLRCVGADDLDPGYVQRLRQHPVSSRVELVGALTHHQVGDAYADADLVVQPSRQETYGMALSEALARGVPVLAARVGGVTEAIGPAHAALLVPPDDAHSLAAALRRWLTDGDLRAALRAGARKRRTTLTGWDQTVTAVARVLREPAVTTRRTPQQTTTGRSSPSAARR